MASTRDGATRLAPLAPDPADLEDRSARAWTERMAVRRLPDGRYAVETDRATYVADLSTGRCTCPDHEIRGERCKHLRRVAIEVTAARVPPPERPACAACGAPAREGEPPLCADCRLDPGDPARDRETGGRVLVLAVRPERADAVELPGLGHTVAAHPTNAAYDPDDPVVEAVYTDAVDRTPPRRYRFPRSRLERIEA
ncbi:MAG: SWIM zinc finger family protein [Halobacteriales archaeon]